MALSNQVEDSLREAESSLRNALSFAARGEKPFVAKTIADLVLQIDNLISADSLIDKLENRSSGDSGMWDTFFGE